MPPRANLLLPSEPRQQERLRDAARSLLGTEAYLGAVPITPILTGLVYSDVVVSGGIVSGVGLVGLSFPAPLGATGEFGATALPLRQERLVRGQGILAINADSRTASPASSRVTCAAAKVGSATADAGGVRC